MKPTYEELSAEYKKLFHVAMSINDSMRREEDHAVFEGGTNEIDDLREIVSRKGIEWTDFLFDNP